ncbi:MAG: hypothetical protein R8G66_14945 [Cytophagales bacterium]|nr:hypothetical protein [Cytophagales bacterium]
MKNSFLMFFALVLFVVACDDTTEFTASDEVVPDLNSLSASIDKDELLDDFALTVAKSMDDPEFRALIKKEAMKMYDGDYDIFYKFLENMPLKDDMVVKELLMDQINGTKTAGRGVSGGNWLDALKVKYPDLQIAVPVNIEKWDTENFTPLVTFLTDDYNEKTTLTVKAYDSKGNAFELSTKEEPDFPVVVISRSERVDGDGNLLYTKDEYIEIKPEESEDKEENAGKSEVFPTAPTNLNILPTGSSGQYILTWGDVANETKYQIMRMRPQDANFQWIADVPANQTFLTTYIGPAAKTFFIVRGIHVKSSGGIDHGPWSAPIATKGSERVDGERLKMARMYLSGSRLKDIEGWVSGAPEIFVRIAIGNTSSSSIIYTSGKLEPGSRGDIKNKWWNKSVTMLNAWDVATFGTVLRINFIERDKSWAEGTKITISTQYEDKMDDATIKSGITAETTINDDLTEFAEDAIFWWQTRDFIYEQNGFKWQLSN